MIWDVFMLGDELDMLQCRLEAMERPDVGHVLVEATTWRRGQPKPLYYMDNRARFARWADRIIHVPVTVTASGGWAHEYAQRDLAWPALVPLLDESDTVIIGDVDEIPSAAMLAWDGATAADVSMRMFCFYVNREVRESPVFTSVLARGKWLMDMHDIGGRELHNIRDMRGDSNWNVVKGGGWHFTWLGGGESRVWKLMRATPHHEIPRYDLLPVEPDETWPAYIWERRCPAGWFA